MNIRILVRLQTKTTYYVRSNSVVFHPVHATQRCTLRRSEWLVYAHTAPSSGFGISGRDRKKKRNPPPRRQFTWYFLMLSNCSLVGSFDDMVTIVLLLMLACWRCCCLIASDLGGGGGGGGGAECLSAGTAEPFWTIFVNVSKI